MNLSEIDSYLQLKELGQWVALYFQLKESLPPSHPPPPSCLLAFFPPPSPLLALYLPPPHPHPPTRSWPCILIPPPHPPKPWYRNLIMLGPTFLENVYRWTQCLSGTYWDCSYHVLFEDIYRLRKLQKQSETELNYFWWLPVSKVSWFSENTSAWGSRGILMERFTECKFPKSFIKTTRLHL